MLHELENQDDYVSAAVWSRGVEALLPKAELIAFVDLGTDPKTNVSVSWDDAVALAGQHMVEVPALRPLRYRVTGFPEPGQLGTP